MLFFQGLRKFKMSAMLELYNFLLAQKNEVRNNVQVILLKFKMATTNRLSTYL